MRHIGLLDFGSSLNYGDTLTSQVLQAQLGARHSNLLVRHAAALPDAPDAGYWRLRRYWSSEFVDGLDAIILFGGSILFPEALHARGMDWILRAHRQGIPILCWGGVQHPHVWDDKVADMAGQLIDLSSLFYCRFSGDSQYLHDRLGVSVEPGADIMCLLPQLESPQYNQVCLSLDLGKQSNTEVTKLVTRLNQIYTRVVYAVVDQEAYAPDKCEGLVEPVQAHHWIQHNVASSHAVISSRLHVLLTAVHNHIPCLGIETGASKVRWLMEDIGLGKYVVDGPLTAKSVMDRYQCLLEERDEVVHQMSVGDDLLQQRAKTAFDAISSAIGDL